MEDTRELILKVATKLFLQKSFKEVTMKEIVQATGMSKGAFYHYFSSKDQLFFEIVEHFMTWSAVDFDSLNKETLYDFYHQVLDCSRKFIPKLKEWFSVDNQFVNYNFYILMFDAINRYPGFLQKVVEHHEMEHSVWTEVVGIARNKGEISSPMTDEQIAKMFSYLPDGISLQSMFKNGFDFLEKEVKELYDALYEELKS